MTRASCLNCSNSGTVIGSGKNVGGITGIINKKSAEFINCNNYGYIEGTEFVGGIVGCAQSLKDILNCKNSGKISASSTDVGGIISVSFFPIENCVNTGEIHVIYQRAGGIAGQADPGSHIINCTNSGIITGGGVCGGITGIMSYFNNEPAIAEFNPCIEQCHNSGKIYGSWNLGGISGIIYPEATITECSNIADIEGEYNIGGISGGLFLDSDASFKELPESVSNSTIEKSYNSGSIIGLGRIGGIVGHINGDKCETNVQQCYNKGTISIVENAGEVIGIELETLETNTFKNLLYLKNSRGLTAIGGKADDESSSVQIMGTTDNLTYDEFQATW